MKGIPRLPLLSSLPRERVEQIESFIEKYELGVSLGRQKTAKFILDIYNEENAKRKKKEKYSRKLLKDAEKLILSMQVSPSRRSHLEPTGTAPARKKGFSKQRGGSEGIISGEEKEKTRKRLKKLTPGEKQQVNVLARKALELGMQRGTVERSLEMAQEAGSGKAIGTMEDSIKAFASMRRVAAFKAAENMRAPGQKTAQEKEALEKAGRGDIAATYRGGAESQMGALEKMGVDMLDAREGLQKIGQLEEITFALNSKNPNEIFRVAKKHGIVSNSLIEASSELRIIGGGMQIRIKDIKENLPKEMEEAFGLIVQGNLQQRISSIPEYQGYRIISMKKLGGMRGAFEVGIEKEGKTRNVYVKLEDLEPALLGKELAEASGLFASKIHKGHEYPTGIIVDGREAMQKFGIMEDIRDYTGKTAMMRVPTGKIDARGVEETRIEEVDVVGASMLYSEVISKPNSENPAHVAFYRMLSTPEGRIGIFRAWCRYHEMSRRALLGDRFPRNTAVVLVKRAGSEEPIITFQPIDLDSIAIFGAKRDGTPDFGLMHTDYKVATEAFIIDLSAASRNEVVGEAAPDGSRFGPEAPLQFEGLAREFLQARPASTYEIPLQTIGGILERYEGKPYGAGNDATDPNSTGNKLGTTAKQGGKAHAFVINEDGRFTLRSREMIPLVRSVEEDFGAFWEEMGRFSLPRP